METRNSAQLREFVGLGLGNPVRSRAASRMDLQSGRDPWVGQIRNDSKGAP